MRILIHGINYAPERIGIGKYTAEMAGWLATRGHEVRVVTAPPYYPEWRRGEGYSVFQYKRELSADVRIWRCPLWVPRAPNGFKRIVHLLSFALSSFPVMLRQVFWRPDVVLTIEPPLFCAPHAWLAARLSGAKAWLHVQDLETAAFFGLGFARSGFLRKCVTSAESLIMRAFDHVSSISNTMVERIHSLGVERGRTSLFPNWVDVQQIHPDVDGRALKNAWGLAGSLKIILYSGNIGKKQGLELLIDSAADVAAARPDALFVIVGEGAAKADLVCMVEDKKLSNIIFKPLQSIEKLPSLLSMADVHLVIQKRGAADAVMPSKLTSILAAGGQAIITADEGTELGRLLREHPGIAVLVEPENREALSLAIMQTLDQRGTDGAVNRVARTYAETHLSTERVLRKFEDELIGLRTGRT